MLRWKKGGDNMEFLISLAVFGIPALAAWVILWKRMEMSALRPRPYRDGEVHPWEVEEERRAERRRINALLEEELMRRAA